MGIVWIGVGIVIWFLVSVVVGLVVGRVLWMRELGADRSVDPVDLSATSEAGRIECRCGHAQVAHEHYTYSRDTRCGLCRCARWVAVDAAFVRIRRELARRWRSGRPTTAP